MEWNDATISSIPEVTRLLFEVESPDSSFHEIVIGERIGLYIEADNGTYPIRSVLRWAFIER